MSSLDRGGKKWVWEAFSKVRPSKKWLKKTFLKGRRRLGVCLSADYGGADNGQRVITIHKHSRTFRGY